MKVYKGWNIFNHNVVNKIKYCCGEAEELFDITGTDIEEDERELYITYTDWSSDYGFHYNIRFGYCPFCGKQIFII